MYIYTKKIVMIVVSRVSTRIWNKAGHNTLAQLDIAKKNIRALSTYLSLGWTYTQILYTHLYDTLTILNISI